MPTYYKLICKDCSNIFNALPRDKNKQFCNTSCANNHKHKDSLIIKLDECLGCNNKLSGFQRKFCSHSCAASYNNSTRPKIEPEESKQSRKDKVSAYHKSYCRLFRCKICLTNHSSEELRKNCEKIHKPQKIKSSITNKKYKRLPEIEVCGPYTKLYGCICKYCKIQFVYRSPFQYCNDHRNYSTDKRSLYRFKFNIFDYPNLFDTKLLLSVGFYGPGGKSKRWNLDGLSRDHKISISDAIKYNYDPYIISHPLNCELMPHRDNNIKKSASSITYAELYNAIIEFDLSNGGDSQNRTDRGR